ncbi:hypothetical protein M5X11_07925 [Paenibacillus alginolyticus]|nr:hypothetical protein [Paenibacillus alginolyticus]MCY9664884.1 hypothetical protein [Paenibacillus alginolyticus]
MAKSSSKKISSSSLAAKASNELRSAASSAKTKSLAGSVLAQARSKQ